MSPTRPISLERPQSQGVRRVLEATALLSTWDFQSLNNDDYVLELSSACYAHEQASKCDEFYATTVALTCV